MSNIEISSEAREAAISEIRKYGDPKNPYGIGHHVQTLLNTVRAADAETIQFAQGLVERGLEAIARLKEELIQSISERDALREQLAQAIREQDESIREANQLLSGL